MCIFTTADLPESRLLAIHFVVSLRPLSKELVRQHTAAPPYSLQTITLLLYVTAPNVNRGVQPGACARTARESGATGLES